MMTDQQREAAARELCRLRGVDPDRMVTRESGPVETPACWVNGTYCVATKTSAIWTQAQWREVAAELFAHEQMQAAIAAGMRSST
jgi:hypothetical protein